jgi:murein DD-endopeptidase MepM/ murein hydrolase activator NlpD
MRKFVASAFRNPAIRLIAAALLASTTASCSSDATRFDNMFSSTDTLTTSSIRHPSNAVNGQVPTPSATVAVASNTGYLSDNSDPLSQPFPSAPQPSYNYGSQTPVASNARGMSNSPVQRTELPAPGAAPAAKPSVVAAADYRTTGSNPRIKMVKGPDPIGMAKPERKPEPNKQVASLGKEAIDQSGKGSRPGKVPVPTHEAAIVPAAPQPEKKKSSVSQAKSGTTDATYTVASGDSLAGIARKHKTTVDALMASNSLTSSNIRIGQQLRIPASGASTTVASAAPVPAVDKKPTASIPTKTVDVAKPKAYSPPVADAKASVSDAAKGQVASIAPAETGIGKYRWPVTGAVIAGFGANVDGQRNDGIDISVPEGTPVKAAENGVVIYSGNGLEKLGNTVLIRHSDGTVTVYAHVKDLDVNRGDKVNRGQVIASSGMTGNASRPKLHFEVRKNSSPVNPMTFLE